VCMRSRNICTRASAHDSEKACTRGCRVQSALCAQSKFEVEISLFKNNYEHLYQIFHRILQLVLVLFGLVDHISGQVESQNVNSVGFGQIKGAASNATANVQDALSRLQIHLYGQILDKER